MQSAEEREAELRALLKTWTFIGNTLDEVVKDRIDDEELRRRDEEEFGDQ
jgi:hypothetical protein